METVTNTENLTSPASKKSSRVWSYIVYGMTLTLLAVVFVEMINIIFYDPYSDEKFLFRTAGILAEYDIATMLKLSE